MAEALIRLDSWKKARAEEKREPPVGNIEQPKLSASLRSIQLNRFESRQFNLDNISIISPLRQFFPSQLLDRSRR